MAILFPFSGFHRAFFNSLDELNPVGQPSQRIMKCHKGNSLIRLLSISSIFDDRNDILRLPTSVAIRPIASL